MDEVIAYTAVREEDGWIVVLWTALSHYVGHGADALTAIADARHRACLPA